MKRDPFFDISTCSICLFHAKTSMFFTMSTLWWQSTGVTQENDQKIMSSPYPIFKWEFLVIPLSAGQKRLHAPYVDAHLMYAQLSTISAHSHDNYIIWSKINNLCYSMTYHIEFTDTHETPHRMSRLDTCLPQTCWNVALHTEPMDHQYRLNNSLFVVLSDCWSLRGIGGCKSITKAIFKCFQISALSNTFLLNLNVFYQQSFCWIWMLLVV